MHTIITVVSYAACQLLLSLLPPDLSFETPLVRSFGFFLTFSLGLWAITLAGWHDAILDRPAHRCTARKVLFYLLV